MQDRIDELESRRDEAIHAGSERSVARQQDKGKLLARERIDYLLDAGSFHEVDMLARHRAPFPIVPTPMVLSPAGEPSTDAKSSCIRRTSP